MKQGYWRQTPILSNKPYSISNTSHRAKIAVLAEENGLKAEEIQKWADDLSAMNPQEYRALLDNLVSENILRINNNGGYSLLTQCTPDLFPSDPLNYIKQIHRYIDYRLQAFLESIAKTGKPATENDWLELQGDYQTKRSPVEFDQQGFERNFKTAKRKLREYAAEGILSITPIPGTDLNFYDFAMLGEREGT